MIRWISILLLVHLPTLAAAACSEGVVDLRGDWGQARFQVEISDDPEERNRGLMFRESMPRSAGMLFIYEEPQRVAFWMRNTLISLDMIFLDPSGTVTRIHENAVPLDETPIPGGNNIQSVLEVNAGIVSLYGIDEGSELRHPGLDQSVAAWGC
ncbi:MAG: DUF192 domain-containing protein [Rhodobacteraceae bacterium]|nr:DUF192 domain-containing protein [Paracoccaceae bacterium]